MVEPAAIALGAPQFGAALAPLVVKAFDKISLPAFPSPSGSGVNVLSFGPFGGAAGFAAWMKFQ